MNLPKLATITVVLLGVVACDPAFINTVPVDAYEKLNSIEMLLPKIDAVAEDHGFYRSSVSMDAEAAVISSGGRLVAWYDRDKVVTLNRGSFVYLAIVQDSMNEILILKLHAFPAWNEPQQLRNLRVDIANILCNNGFRVEGGCGV